jgi:aryl-alcohol dehydrogenase-like predicted oxidoreductase
LMKAMWISERFNLNRFISVQPPYSLVKRHEFERELEAVCQDQQVGVIPYSPLQGGFLTGKYRREIVPDSVRAEGLKSFFTEKNFALIDLLAERGKAYNASVTQMALAWLLRRPSITSPIIGANTVVQLKDILGSIAVELSDDDYQAIDTASEWRG